jgi:hypothetical protein
MSGRDRRKAMQAAEKRRIAAADPDPTYGGRLYGDPFVELPDDPFEALAEWNARHTAAPSDDSGRKAAR